VSPLSVSSRPSWVSENLFPFSSRFAEIDGARLHYVDEGSGPPLLFLHGSPMWSFMFRHAIGDLRARFRCVAVDMPGLGLSTAPIVNGRSFERNANYYRRFVRMLGLDEFVLIAHATAGPPALRMAIEERQRLRGIVITNSLAWSMRSFPSMWRFVRIVNSPPFQFLNERVNLLPRVTSCIARSTGKFTDDEKRAILGPYANRDARRHLNSLLYSLRAEIPFFEKVQADLNQLNDLRVLFLYGARDNGYLAGFLDRWKQLLPNHSVAILEKSAHFPTEDEPEAYTRALREWLDAVP
jgi:haloalkane dehalogenase